MVQGFIHAEVFETVAEGFDAEKGGELLVHPQDGVLGAGA
jgi:hypothetical protein